MPFHTGRLEGDSPLARGNATLEIMLFLTRLGVIADMVVYSRRTPEQLIFVGTHLQGAFDDAEGLTIAPPVLTIGKEAIGLGSRVSAAGGGLRLAGYTVSTGLGSGHKRYPAQHSDR